MKVTITQWKIDGASHDDGRNERPEPDDGQCIFETIDLGAGPYIVMQAREYVWNNLAEFDAWAAKVREIVATVEGKD